MKEHLKFFPFHVFFKSQRLSPKTVNSPSATEKKITGFTLSWFVEDSNGTQFTEKLPARQEDWKQEVAIPRYKEPLILDMVQLLGLGQFRLENLKEEDIAKKEEQITMQVFQQKLQNIDTIDVDKQCSMDQLKSNALGMMFSKLSESCRIL